MIREHRGVKTFSFTLHPGPLEYRSTDNSANKLRQCSCFIVLVLIVIITDVTNAVSGLNTKAEQAAVIHPAVPDVQLGSPSVLEPIPAVTCAQKECRLVGGGHLLPL